MYLVARNSILLHANNKGADQPAHPRSQLALESMLHAKNENKKFYRQTCVCGSRQLQRGRGDCFSMEVRTSFSSRKYMTTCIFSRGRSGAPAPPPRPPPPPPPPPPRSLSVSAHIKVSNSLDICIAGPGRFTNRLLIISADLKGKDSMILFKIKETAHFNSGHVLF